MFSLTAISIIISIQRMRSVYKQLLYYNIWYLFYKNFNKQVFYFLFLHSSDFIVNIIDIKNTNHDHTICEHF